MAASGSGSVTARLGSWSRCLGLPTERRMTTVAFRGWNRFQCTLEVKPLRIFLSTSWPPVATGRVRSLNCIRATLGSAAMARTLPSLVAERDQYAMPGRLAITHSPPRLTLPRYVSSYLRRRAALGTGPRSTTQKNRSYVQRWQLLANLFRSIDGNALRRSALGCPYGRLACRGCGGPAGPCSPYGGLHGNRADRQWQESQDHLVT